MRKELDCRGLACPAPVLRAKQIIETENPDAIRLIVDNEAAKQNVSRFLESRKYEVSSEKEGADFYVVGKRGAGCAVTETPVAEDLHTQKKKIMVMVATDRMGYGDDALGKKLVVNFINTLDELGDELWRLVFVNNGVKLTIGGSEVLPVLKKMEKAGRTILVCGTCLDHFKLLDKKEVGETTNMLDIVTAMQLADKVISI